MPARPHSSVGRIWLAMAGAALLATLFTAASARPAAAPPQGRASGGSDLPAPPQIEEILVSAPEPRYVAPTTRDRIGRLWAPVLINGSGPYRFVLDTGASHFAVVPFSYSGRRGMRVNVMAGPVKATALIDTGAQVTVGNPALRQALARRRSESDLYDNEIIGVTDDIQQATRVRIPGIVAGQLVMRNATIMFSDLHIFEHWQLNSEPALLIGMDVLGVLDTLIIDYKLRELQILTSRDF